tara:strand:+ start:202 stop:936 length:735 start_codon:yes stop_codon:yes gene_type:complete
MIKKLFTFWKQKEKPKVHWWSIIEGVQESTPILPAKEFIPNWWKKIEKVFDPQTTKGTVKNCPAIVEYLTQGFVVPLWCDLYLKLGKEGWEWKSPDRSFTVSFHNNDQFRNLLPQHAKDNISMIVKPDCPWRIKTPPGWSVWQLPMAYHYNPIFEVLPGIIWTDIYHEINQQMVMKEFGEFKIPRGTPLAMYVPFKRDKYIYEINGPNAQNAKWNAASSAQQKTKFMGGYKLHQKKVRKCPIKH